MTYQLKMHSYCGISEVLCTGTIHECRLRARSRIRYFLRKIGEEIDTLVPGLKWELLTPDTALMVSDFEGVLSIQEVKDDSDRTEDVED